MFNKNKTIAAITCFITTLVAIFVFICPVNYYESQITSHPVVSMSDCGDSSAHSPAHNTNDIAKKCVDFHVASAQYYMAIQAKTLSMFSVFILLSTIIVAILTKHYLSATEQTSLARVRHRYLFYLNKLKLLQTKKFREWLTLLNYREIVSVA